MSAKHVWPPQERVWWLSAILGLLVVGWVVNLLVYIAGHIGMHDAVGRTDDIAVQAMFSLPVILCWVAMLVWQSGGLVWTTLALLATTPLLSDGRFLASPTDGLGQLGQTLLVAGWVASQVYLPLMGLRRGPKGCAEAEPEARESTMCTGVVVRRLAMAVSAAGGLVALAAMVWYLVVSWVPKLGAELPAASVGAMALLLAIAWDPRGRREGRDLWVLTWAFVLALTVVTQFLRLEPSTGLVDYHLACAHGRNWAATYAIATLSSLQVWAFTASRPRQEWARTGGRHL